MVMKSVAKTSMQTRTAPARRTQGRANRAVIPRMQENNSGESNNQNSSEQNSSAPQSSSSSEPLGSAQASTTPSSAGSQLQGRSFNDVMAFSGWAPETINGRMAMIGFLAGVGAEFAAGESFPYQFKAHFVAFASHAAIFSLASFMPSLQGSATYTSDPSSIPASQIVGPFTASAERFNGRGAMIGVAAMLVIETIRGGPLLA